MAQVEFDVLVRGLHAKRQADAAEYIGRLLASLPAEDHAAISHALLVMGRDTHVLAEKFRELAPAGKVS